MPPQSHPTEVLRIHCPRCGYDQRGAMATWTDSCPVEGVCAECGLHWEWAELLQERLRLPRWNVESADGFRNAVVRSLRTSLMVFRPFRFWRELRMHHVFRPRRIMSLWLFFLVISYIGFAVASGIKTWNMLQSSSASDSEKLLTCAYAVALPFADSAPQFLVRPTGIPQWSPKMFNASLWQIDIYDIRKVGTFIISRDPTMLPWAYGLKAIIWVVLLGSMAAFTPLGFMAIPFSRVQAKVRTLHLVRIALYSLVPIGMMMVIVHAVGNIWFPRSTMLLLVFYRVVYLSVAFSLFWYPIFLAVWWSAACRSYLKIPHSWGVGICFALIGSLTTFLIVTVLTMLFHD